MKMPMNLDQQTAQPLFTASDLSAAIGVIRALCQRPVHVQPAMAKVIAQMTQVLAAQSASVYESRSTVPIRMLQTCRHEWDDWQTEAILESLAGRRMHSGTVIHMTWQARAEASQNDSQWHCVSSSHPNVDGRYLTLAFARQSQPFSERETTLLRTLHQSGLFELLVRRPSISVDLPLSPKLREVLTGLLHGQSEKQIAAGLRRSQHTVHSHVKALYRRYGVTTRGELLSLSIDPTTKRVTRS